jgi:hypothetical protein
MHPYSMQRQLLRVACLIMLLCLIGSANLVSASRSADVRRARAGHAHHAHGEHTHERERHHPRHRHTRHHKAPTEEDEEAWSPNTPAALKLYTGATARPLAMPLSIEALPASFNWCHTNEGRSFCTSSWNQHIPQYVSRARIDSHAPCADS